MMNLLIVSPSAAHAGGGVSEAVRQLGRLLKDRPDVRLRVLAMVDGPEAPSEWEGIDVRTFRFFGPASYSFSPGLLLALLRAPADVIHVHGIWKFHCLAVHLASRLRGIPYVVTPHGMMERWIRDRSKTLKALVSRLYQNSFLRRAHAFHILTEKERGDVDDMAAAARCMLIPNFVEPAPARPAKPAWWRPEYEGKDIYLFFGRIHEKKGCIELCDAWALVNDADPAFRAHSVLVFCGPIDGIADFQQRVAALSERFGNACFAGPQYGEDKGRSLAVASFLCLPSKSEGLPLAILESWAASVPVIMTPECNLAIGFARHAALATTPAVDGITRSLREASALDAAERAAMAANGRDLIAEHFSPKAMEDALLQLYADAAHAHG